MYPDAVLHAVCAPGAGLDAFELREYRARGGPLACCFPDRTLRALEERALQRAEVFVSVLCAPGEELAQVLSALGTSYADLLLVPDWRSWWAAAEVPRRDAQFRAEFARS